jgi:fatty acid desaturase
MDESFYESKKLPKEQLFALMQKKDHPAIGQFSLMCFLFFGSGAWIVLSWNGPIWQLIASHLLFGIMCCSTFACLHETVHNTAFRSKSLNQLAARICGFAQIYPATVFREFHFTHHRHTHVPGMDPEISLGHKPITGLLSSIPIYLSWITGIPFLLFKSFMLIAGAFGMPEFLRKNFFPFIRPEVRLKLAIECCCIFLIYAGLVSLALYVNPGFWGIFTGLMFGHCILASYLLPEHNGLPHKGHILEKTRSMNTNKLVKVLMWNMPYHAEHHAYPAIPFHSLPDLHELLREEIMHKEEDYPDFHFKVIKRKIR